MSEQILVKLSEQTLANPIIDLLNKFLKANLPAINSEIQKIIKQNGLDPMADVDHGSKDLGIVEAKHKIYDLKGLSTLTLLSLEIMNVNQNPKDPDGVLGVAQIKAKLSSDIQTRVSGSLSPMIGPSVGLSGTVKASNVTAESNVSLIAGINGVKLCLKSLDITEFSIFFGDVDVNIDDLGPLNKALDPLVDFLCDRFKGEIRSFIASKVKSAVQKQVNGHLPFCVGIPL